MFIIEGTALNLSQTWAMDKQIHGPQWPYDTTSTLDEARGELSLAWGHLVESGGLHPHQQAEGAVLTMDNDNDGQEKLFPWCRVNPSGVRARWPSCMVEKMMWVL